jgi:hypothetical protein
MQDYRKLSLTLFLIGTDRSLEPRRRPGKHVFDLNLDRFSFVIASLRRCDVHLQFNLSDLQNVIAAQRHRLAGSYDLFIHTDDQTRVIRCLIAVCIAKRRRNAKTNRNGAPG